MVKQIILVNF